MPFSSYVVIRLVWASNILRSSQSFLKCRTYQVICFHNTIATLSVTSPVLVWVKNNFDSEATRSVRPCMMRAHSRHVRLSRYFI